MSSGVKDSPKDEAEIDVNPDIDEKSLRRQKSLKLEEQEEGFQLSELTKINSDLISVSLQSQNYKFLTKLLDVQRMERSVLVNLFMGASKKHVSQLLSFLT